MAAFRKVGATVLWGAVVWLVLAALAALQFWPAVPKTARGWVLFVAFAPPLYLLGEAVSEWLWSTRIGRYISNHPSPAMRVTLGVVLFSLIMVAGFFIARQFEG